MGTKGFLAVLGALLMQFLGASTVFADGEAILIGDTSYVRESAVPEELTASFGGGTVTTAPGANQETTQAYSGLVEIVVSGTGQSLGTRFNDAFWLLDPTQHNSRFYQLAIDTATIQGTQTTPTLPAQLAKNLIVYDLDAGLATTPPYVPPARLVDNTYRFVIDVSLTDAWTGSPSTLNFTVANGIFGDNSGEYEIDVYQLVEDQVTEQAVVVQAVPIGSQTRVAVKVSGGVAGAPVPPIELQTSDTCVDGVLETPEQLGVLDPTDPTSTLINELTDNANFDANGDALIIDPTQTGASNPFNLPVVSGASRLYVGARAISDSSSAVGETSACIVSGPDNDTWTRAQEVVLNGSDPATSAPDNPIGFVDNPGTARWYKFRIFPGARATVTLTGNSPLPEDLDLAVFRDITQAFEELVGDNDVDGLNRLSAEFAPSAFSPSAFSPSAFSPSAFSPSAFSPSAFSPSAFSPSAFSPSAFSPSAFSPSAFSPSAFSPSAFSPSAFSPSAFSPSAFSPSAFSPSAFSGANYASAQVRSLIAVSAQEGTGPERIVADTWSNTGFFYVRVTGKNGAFTVEAPFQLSIQLDGSLCEGVSVPPAPDYSGVVFDSPDSGGSAQSLLLIDSEQLRVSGYSVDEIAALRARLDVLAARDEVAGVVVDLGSFGQVQFLHGQAQNASSCVYATNLTALEIKGVVDAFRQDNPELRYVVLAGGDAEIPYFRYPDQSLLGPESGYNPPMREGTPARASLGLNYVLGQDQYGAATTLSLRDGEFPVPKVAVGRLVETIDEMIGIIDAYLSAPGGIVTPTSTLVTGYDFLQDSADAVQEQFVLGTNGGGASAERNDTLITDGDIAPQDPRSWTADDLRRELLDQGEDLIFLSGHFSANSALAADYQTEVIVTELAASGVDLFNAIVFSGGCHSGYNIVNGESIDGLTLKLDWAQAFAQKQATLIAGTGYQYGDTDFIEYSERLYVLFAQELRRNLLGPVSVGEALVRAKQRYLLTEPDPKGLHRKSLLISTIFGLPMLRVDLQGEPFLGEDELPVVGGTSPVVGPGSQFNLRTAELPVDFGIRPSGPANLIPRTVDLDVLDDPTDPLPTRQITAEYLEGPDGVVTNPGEPAVPLESLNVSVPMTSLRGVGFRGGSWEEDAVIPLTGAAATEIRGVHVPFSSQLLYPIRLATASYFGALDGGVERTTILHVTPTQHRVESVGQETAIRRVSTNLGYRLFYSDNTRQFGPNLPALSSPPTITRVEATRDGDDVVFEVAVVGDPAAGIQEVWVTYTEGEASSGTWVSLDLAQDPGDSRRWIGQLEDGAVNFTRLDFLVQAVNGVGLVARDDNFGRFYRQFGAGSTVPAEKVDTTLVLEAPVPTSGVYGTSVTVSATLAESPASSGAIEDGLPVVFTLGATTRIGATDGGVATVNLPLNAVPGDYLLVASFGGNDALNSSSASSEFAVLKANTALSVAVGANTVGVDGVDPGIVARLTDQNDFPLQDQTVFFTISGGPEGEVTKAVKTKVDGTASAGSFALPAGSYTVVARFLGEIPVDGDSFDLEDPVYNPAISSTTPFEIENGRGCPDSGASGNVSPRGFCYLTENVSGNVIARNGTLVLGAGARISGNLEQRRSGGVVILDGARVNGNVIEASDGGITIQDARVNGNVEEAGLGNVRIGEGADVRGNVSERGDGSVFVDGKVAGSVTERGSGTVELGPDGRIGGS